MKKSEQILIGVCGVVIAGTAWFLLAPQSGANKANLVPLSKAIADTETSKRNVIRLTEEQGEIEPRVLARAYKQPADQVVPVVVGNLQTAAERAGIHLREVRPLRPKIVTDEMDPKPTTKTKTTRTSRSSTAKHVVL